MREPLEDQLPVLLVEGAIEEDSGVPFLAAAAVVGVASVLAFRERAPGEAAGVGVSRVARSESG